MRKYYLITMLLFLIFSFQTKTLASSVDSLAITSEAVILMDTKSGAILYEKNANKMMYPASLTKIATAIYAIENGNLQDMVTVSENAFRTVGSSVYLETGEVVSLKHLIQGMLINSGNDAAVAIADYFHGNVEQFSIHLNKYLQEKVGVNNTHFSNPHGLFSDDHYTTAGDLAKMTNYAMKNTEFREIFGTKLLKWEGKSWDTTLISHHLMLKGEFPYDGITGGKTGYVSEAKSTLATTADNGQIQLTAIVLKAGNQKQIYKDTKQLLDYGFQNFKTTSIPVTQKFTVDDKNFFPAQSISISEALNGVHFEISKDGMLKVQTNEYQTLQTVKLNPEIIPNQVELNKAVEKNSLINMNTFFGTLVIVAAGAIIKLRKKNNV